MTNIRFHRVLFSFLFLTYSFIIMLHQSIILFLLVMAAATGIAWSISYQQYYFFPGDKDTRYFQDISFTTTDYVGIKSVAVLGLARFQIVISDFPVLWFITNRGIDDLFYGCTFWHRSRSAFYVRKGSDSFGNTRFYEIQIPFWALMTAFCSYPLIALFFGPLRRLRRRMHGLCSKCGYNLTGNTSGICPECGTPVSGDSKFSASGV